MTIKKALFATKFGELNLEVLKSLFDLKPAGLEEIVLAHVIPRDEVAFVPYGGYLKDEEERLREECRIRFEDWQDDILRAGIRCKICIEVGDPIPGIMKIAETEEVNLIVSGKARQSSLERLYVSSHTLELLRRNHTIPVLVSKQTMAHGSKEEWIGLKNEHPFEGVLFASDWSLPSERALRFLACLKGVVKKVDVVHVLFIETPDEDGRSEWDEIKAKARERLQGACDFLRKAGIEAEPHLAAGDAASEIMRLAHELNATMTVLGTGVKDRIHALLLGSASQQIAERSDLPTLLVP